MSVQDPAQLHHAFENAINAHDVDAVLALYDPNGIAVQLDGSECTGEGPMRAMVEGLVAGIVSIKGTDRKLFVADDVALSSGTWIAEIRLPDGTLVTQEGTTAEVARRQADGSWKFVIDDPMFV